MLATSHSMWGYATGNRFATTVVAVAIAIAAIAFVARRIVSNRAAAKLWASQLDGDRRGGGRG
jgi:hypothetical protein